MRILVYPTSMEIGGSQINAIELAHEAARSGHDVVVFGPDGDIVPMVRDFGLEFVQSPTSGRWPTVENQVRLSRLVADRRIDIVHGYEWGPALDLVFGPQRRFRTPLVTTVLSMSVSSVVPRHGQLVVGTRQIFDEQSAVRAGVHLIEPPIDTHRNRAGRGGGRLAREAFGFAESHVVVSVICRLTPDLGKLEGVLEAIEVVDRLAETHPVRLVVAGTGGGLARVTEHARAANARHGETVVTVAGPLLDPRPAYDAADVVIGMGSSALKGMAFGKPIVVQGEHGFWTPLTRTTLPRFLVTGWYGSGGAGPDDLAAALIPLIVESRRRDDVGSLGRAVVVENYSLERAARAQLEVYDQALEGRMSRRQMSIALGRCAVDVAKDKAATRRDAVAGWFRTPGQAASVGA